MDNQPSSASEHFDFPDGRSYQFGLFYLLHQMGVPATPDWLKSGNLSDDQVHKSLADGQSHVLKEWDYEGSYFVFCKKLDSSTIERNELRFAPESSGSKVTWTCETQRTGVVGRFFGKKNSKANRTDSDLLRELQDLKNRSEDYSGGTDRANFMEYLDIIFGK